MQNKRLGKDLLVSAIGLGCMGMSHAYGRPSTLQEARNIFAQALDCGYTFFDTAESYGNELDPHHNENLLGELLRPYRDKVVIATKFGIRFDETSSEVNKPLVADSRRKQFANRWKVLCAGSKLTISICTTSIDTIRSVPSKKRLK